MISQFPGHVGDQHNKVSFLAALPGTGKSHLLNLLLADNTNRELRDPDTVVGFDTDFILFGAAAGWAHPEMDKESVHYVPEERLWAHDLAFLQCTLGNAVHKAQWHQVVMVTNLLHEFVETVSYPPDQFAGCELTSEGTLGGKLVLPPSVEDYLGLWRDSERREQLAYHARCETDDEFLELLSSWYDDAISHSHTLPDSSVHFLEPGQFLSDYVLSELVAEDTYQEGALYE